MDVGEAALRGQPPSTAQVLLLTPKRLVDARGWFMETWSEAQAASAGIHERFVQDNQSFSAAAGTIRGLHFQRPPRAQAKLVRCVRGSIMDYVVDVRRGSPTYGRWLSAKLTADGGEQLYMPTGFAHGFVTLEQNVEIAYKVSDVYEPNCDGGVAWDDPTINIDWPLPESGAVVSDKDKLLPRLAVFDSPFDYDGWPLGPLVRA